MLLYPLFFTDLVISAGPLLVHPLRQHVGVEGVPCPARVPIRPVGPGGGLHVAGPHGGLRTCRESG